MVVEHPQWFKELAQGMIDIHIHPAPCIYQRVGDEYDISIQAKELGYKGIMFKSHIRMNADKTEMVRKTLGFEAHGGLILSSYIGELNPDAVESAIYCGAKEIWMPVFHAEHHIKRFGYPGLPGLSLVSNLKRPKKNWRGIPILDNDKELLPELKEILGIIADADIILATGHISLEENYTIVEAARREGIKKILVTHAQHAATGWPIEDQIKLAGMGAYIEHVYPSGNLDSVAEALKTVGPERCVMGTDGGTIKLPHPTMVMKMFIEEMLKRNIEEKSIEIMTKKNPAKLLNI
jgi:hypothetical protein